MDDKTKLYVFEKKEVFLIFVFMILIAITSFLIGVKIGTNFSYQQAGFTAEDKMNIEIQSKEEEKVQKIVDTTSEKSDSKKIEDLNSFTEKVVRKKLEEEFSEDKKEFGNLKASPVNENMEQANPTPKKEEAAPQVMIEPPKDSKPSDKLTGKYTIQIGSYRAINDAEQFSDGYKVRGYDPIINEVELRNRGIWYRVSLGAFETILEAKDFIIKNKNLFAGGEYVIVQFE
jgi:cell division protein FtsN